MVTKKSTPEYVDIIFFSQMSLPFQFYLKLSDHMGQVNFSSQLYVLLCGLDPFPIFQALMKVIWGNNEKIEAISEVPLKK